MLDYEVDGADVGELTALCSRLGGFVEDESGHASYVKHDECLGAYRPSPLATLEHVVYAHPWERIGDDRGASDLPTVHGSCVRYDPRPTHTERC
jgi:hypothetical protein